MTSISEKVKQGIYRRFQDKFPLSKALQDRACKSMPAGHTKSVAFHHPHMIYAATAQGARVTTEDGVELLDFVSAYGTLVLGHAHPVVEEATARVAKQGSIFGTAAKIQVEFAEAVCARVPAVEQVRFTATGSEAVTFAIKAARAFTKKPSVLIFRGCFHGTGHMCMEIPNKNAVGVYAVPEQRVFVAEFNDAAGVRDVLLEHGHEIACVLMEPVLGANGVVRPTAEFLQAIYDEAEKQQTLIVCDEILTLRCHYEGVHALYKEQFNLPRLPDLVILGKLIGGGYPMGLVGGRREVMSVFDEFKGPLVFNSGSYFGHGVSCAAGLEALRLCTREVMLHIRAEGEWLARQLQRVHDKLGLQMQINHEGPLLYLHFSAQPVTNGTLTAEAATPLQEWLYLELLNEGVFVLPRLMMFVSAAHTRGDLEVLVGAYERAMQKLLPAIEEMVPSVVGKGGQ